MLYALVVVIILSTMLIAIATDSYEVIKNERASIVFWSNRLDLIAETDAIHPKFTGAVKNMICRSRVRYGVPGAPNTVQEVPHGAAIATAGNGGDHHLTCLPEDDKDSFRDAWYNLLGLFEGTPNQSNNLMFCSYKLLLQILAIVIILIWVLAGIITCGVLWPPQVRKFLFEQKRTAVSAADMNEKIDQDMKHLKKRMADIRVNSKQKTKNDQKQWKNIIMNVERLQRDAMSDIAQLKENLTTLTALSREKLCGGEQSRN